MSSIENHDSYISAAPEQFQSTLRDLRMTIKSVLPEAEEMIAYNMPGFAIGGKVVASYAAFSKQCGLYLLAGAITAYQEDLQEAGFKPTKTGIKFTVKKPIPHELVENLAKASRDELNA